HYSVNPGNGAVGDEMLGPVQHIVIAFPFGPGPYRGRIRSCVRFCQSEGPDHFPRGHSGQVLSLLFFVSHLDNTYGTDPIVTSEQGSKTIARATQLFQNKALAHHVGSHSAV